MENSSGSKKIKRLLKNNSRKKSFKSENNIDYCRNKINSICRSLSKPTKIYNPEITVKSICVYLSEGSKLQRILYSEISTYIFSLDLERRGIFATNVESLLNHTQNKDFSCENVSKEDCQKIIIKIYDHSQLASYQVENAKSILNDGVAGLKEDLRKENKGIEREYITILAIFSSIVVTFIGGVSFSNEVLQNTYKVSIYRLLMTIDGLGFVLTNITYMMIYLIFEINDKKMRGYNIWWINSVFFIIALLIVIAWCINIHKLPNYLNECLPIIADYIKMQLLV